MSYELIELNITCCLCCPLRQAAFAAVERVGFGGFGLVVHGGFDAFGIIAMADK